MRSSPATFRLTPCLIAAAAVLLLGGRASASCGDYVHVRTAGQKADPDQKQPAPADSPCAHGQCDRAPITPPPAEPNAPTSGGHDAVLATVSDIPPVAGPSYTDCEVGVPSHVSSVPFHPPRV